MEVSELVRSLLMKRGVLGGDVDIFLHPAYDRDTHSPMLLDGMERAVARLLSALTAGERIAIYADFDCDGIPGAALLYDALTKLEHKNMEVYIPHRDMEGYGFHKEAIESLAQRNVSLILTVDVGTTAVESVRFAKEKGIDVIVTDHHEPIREPSASNGPGSVKIPEAVAVVNPKVGDYPFRELCGAAVAWKLVQALFMEGRKRGIPRFQMIPEGWEKWLLDLVAIATIADMVPLVGENRALVHFGLTVLRKSPRQGIRALCTQLRLRQTELTEDDVSFSFAPRINAASRMGHPETAFKLLSTNSQEEAEHIARELEDLNKRRKGAVGSIVKEARRRVSIRYSSAERVVVLGDVEWRPALLGLVANSIVEERGGLVCMWGRNGKGELKGSCRSDGSVSVVKVFEKASVSFEEYGGHHGSGGFSISHEAVHTLPEVLKYAAEELNDTVMAGKTEYDALIGLSELSWLLFKDVSRLAPFGLGNPKPVFRISRTSVASMRTFGKDNNHVEVIFSCQKSGAQARAFDFFRSPTSFQTTPHVGAETDVLATLVHDTYRGSQSIALRLVDIVRSS